VLYGFIHYLLIYMVFGWFPGYLISNCQFVCLSVSQGIGWLFGWLVDWLVGWLASWLVS
jgi:hypothetical protein